MDSLHHGCRLPPSKYGLPTPFSMSTSARSRGAVHHGRHEPAGEFPGLDVDQAHLWRHERFKGRLGHDRLLGFGLAFAELQLRRVNASQVLFRRHEMPPYAIMSPKSTMSNQLFAYAEILENAVQDILRAHGTGDFT